MKGLKTVALLVLLGFAVTVSTAQTAIHNFIVKEDLLKGRKLAIIAAGENDLPDTRPQGTYVFSVNGFRQDLVFHDGVAVMQQPLERSTFLYFKYEKDTVAASKLYYVLKSGDDLNPVGVSWVLLAIIPLALIVIAMLFRRMIILAAILLIALFYFNGSRGLQLPTFFETVVDGVRSLI